MGEVVKGDFGKEDPLRRTYENLRHALKQAAHRVVEEESKESEVVDLPSRVEPSFQDRFEGQLIDAFDRLHIEDSTPPNQAS